MIIVADSGSTKCDWVVLDGKRRITEVSTIGFNPYHHSSGFISEALSATPALAAHANAIKHIYFYGAGCSSEVRNATVYAALRTVFSRAEIVVGHDVLGAAIAACGGKPGIACILGTGSNSCYFDGQQTSEVLPSLGYILGDEGSGAWFGKQLLTDHLYGGPLPIGLKDELLQNGFEKETVLEHIYMKPHANAYLASVMKILAHHRSSPYVQQLLEKGMIGFLKRHVCCFDNYKRVPTSFVGSVAFHFQDVVEAECRKLGITFGNVIQKPIDGLVAFHSAE